MNFDPPRWGPPGIEEIAEVASLLWICQKPSKECNDYLNNCASEGESSSCPEDNKRLAQKACNEDIKGACSWLKNPAIVTRAPTTKMVTTELPTTETPKSTVATNMLPFIIGGVVGVIVLLAIGIGLYCYCRKKKKMGGQKKAQGLNTSGTTVNSVTTGTGTGTTATGTRKTDTNTQSRY